MPSNDELIKDRGSEYGDFCTQANIAQGLKMFVRNGISWSSMGNSKKEAIDMCLHKISRIVNGNHSNIDSWQDASAYLQLIVKEITK